MRWGQWRAMWILFDDARPDGASPRLYREPRETIVARKLDQVLPALEQLRSGLRGGMHAAGYLAYEAGCAFDPKLRDAARQGEGPLLCFGLFDGYETPELASLLPSPERSTSTRRNRPDPCARCVGHHLPSATRAACAA